jgi:predicted transcriptional regulator
MLDPKLQMKLLEQIENLQRINMVLITIDAHTEGLPANETKAKLLARDIPIDWSDEFFQTLVDDGLIEEREGRYYITEQGRRWIKGVSKFLAEQSKLKKN